MPDPATPNPRAKIVNLLTSAAKSDSRKGREMYLSELRAENFRLFGAGEKAFVLPLKQGLTALVGENDTGKTAVIDALRFALGTRDQEYIRIDDKDFHRPYEGDTPPNIHVRCKFTDLNIGEKGAFAEYLTYEAEGPVLYVNWVAKPNAGSGIRRFAKVEVRSGAKADGPTLVAEVRESLRATYLRPLRDAEREMSSGRGSRLSQILEHTNEIAEDAEKREHFDAKTTDNTDNLSILGIGDWSNHLFKKHPAIAGTKSRLNEKYLAPLSFMDDRLEGQIDVTGSDKDTLRLRQFLEKLELYIGAGETPDYRGLGSHNILYMACELLLLGSENEDDGLPLLLIEEPEAHLHPQRQLRLMHFLQEKAEPQGKEGRQIQIIVTTHSPNLASVIKLDNMVVLRGGNAFSLAEGKTKLDKTDYRFLERFLDVTKANLFFARGVMIVEGDAENILLPTLAKLIGRDFSQHGVSIVNVGHTGLGRYSRIFQRRDGTVPIIGIPVACVTDLDVMPDCALEIFDREGRTRSSLGIEAVENIRKSKSRFDGQGIRTLVSGGWTLEYDLAYSGLAKEVWIAACLANYDTALHRSPNNRENLQVKIIEEAKRTFDEMQQSLIKIENEREQKEAIASHVYSHFLKVKTNFKGKYKKDGKTFLKRETAASKAIAAQYLAERLITEFEVPKTGDIETITGWETKLPDYLVSAIKHVTPSSDLANQSGAGKSEVDE